MRNNRECTKPLRGREGSSRITSGLSAVFNFAQLTAPTSASGLWGVVDPGGSMNFADECRRRALIVMEIGRRAPDLEARALFVAEQWLTLAAIEEIVHGVAMPSDSQSFH
jgi:hypothetical protein